MVEPPPAQSGPGEGGVGVPGRKEAAGGDASNKFTPRAVGSRSASRVASKLASRSKRGNEEEDASDDSSDEGPCAEDEASVTTAAPGHETEEERERTVLGLGQFSRSSTEESSESREGALPLFNEQRYHFWRSLMPAPRSGGQIELYVDRMTGATVVVKRVPQQRLLESPEAYRRENPNELEDPWQELVITQRLGAPGPDQVPGVCPCHGAYVSVQGDALLVSDYLPGGDLFDVANSFGLPGPSRERQAWPLVCSLVEAVLTLHVNGVAHGDVSLENTLRQRSSSSRVALVDFGMAVIGDLTKATGIRGKPSYQAPEMHLQATYDARCTDLFACGVAAYGLAVGGYPWSSTRQSACLAFAFAWRHGLQAFLERRRVTVDGVKTSVADCLSPRYLKLLSVLLDFEPSRRLAVRSCDWRALAGTPEV